MAAVVVASLVDIYDAIRKQLLARIAGLADGQIKLTAHPSEVPAFDAEHDIVVRVGSLISVLALWSGMPAHKVRRYITFYPRTRMALDPHDRDTQWMLSAAGHIRWEEKVMVALWGFFPNDAEDSEIGNLFTYQEMQFSQGGDPVKGEMDVLWGSSALTCEVEYLLSLGAGPLAG